MSRAMFRLLGAMMALGLLAVPHDAEATIVWSFSTEFSESGGTLSGPVAVTLDDGGGSGSVDVTIDTSGLSLTEKITGLYLNLDPSLDLTSLTYLFPDNNTDPLASVSIAADTFKADGDGFFDIWISWPTEESGIFGINETDTITFTLAGLVEESFLFLSSAENADGSAKSGGKGPFLAALRAQSLGDNSNGSGWFSPTGGFVPGDETLVPEPGSLALFGVGLAGLAFAIRRRRKISWHPRLPHRAQSRRRTEVLPFFGWLGALSGRLASVESFDIRRSGRSTLPPFRHPPGAVSALSPPPALLTVRVGVRGSLLWTTGTTRTTNQGGQIWTPIGGSTFDAD